MSFKVKEYYEKNKKSLLIIVITVAVVLGLLVVSNYLFPKKRKGLENFKNMTTEERQEKMDEMRASGAVMPNRQSGDRPEMR